MSRRDRGGAILTQARGHGKHQKIAHPIGGFAQFEGGRMLTEKNRRGKTPSNVRRMKCKACMRKLFSREGLRLDVGGANSR